MLFRTILNEIKCKQNFRSLRFFYDSRTKHDTIFAPLVNIQPIKGSPLGVIRVSGIKTENILHQLTRYAVLRNDPNSIHVQPIQKNVIRPRYATLTKIVAPETNELIDIGLVLWFPSPHSYTGEDVCEFHLHGSRAVMTTMLTILGNISGLRPAEPGEFTRRAVENGKMSLIEAESLPELIASQTDYQRKLALKGLDGSTRDRYVLWIKKLVDILAHLEASIDFGEDELIGERGVLDNCINNLKNISQDIYRFIKVSVNCREIIHSGIKVVILGKPNAGKSTFMNLLCRQDKSIVSDLSGTTRDVVEHSFDMGGHALTLCDTAGLKDLSSSFSISDRSFKTLLEHHDIIEREGIRRALEAARKADVILYLIDGSNLFGEESEFLEITKEVYSVLQVLDEVNESKVIHLIINKIDINGTLTNNNDNGRLEKIFKTKCGVVKDVIITFISCTTLENFDHFVDQFKSVLDKLASNMQTVSERFKSENKHGVAKLDYVNERHLSLLKSTQRHLERASKLNMDTIDEMAQHVRESVDYLSRIVGSVSNEQVIDVIFRDFCIGK